MPSGSKFSVEAVFKAVDRWTAPLRKMRKGVDGVVKAGARINAVSNSINKLNASMWNGAKAAAKYGGALALGAGLIGKSILDSGAGFEQAITNVGSVMLRTREEIAALEKEALRLGATTKFTATESANAMEIMARAGFKDAEILAGVGPILNAAAASGLEIAEVADHVSNALKGMGMETKEAGRVADVLALASSRTNSSIGSLGESLSNVSSTARQFNIPLEETVAAVALLQDVGLDASVAGSALNTMLTQMAAPTDSLRKKMDSFGVSFSDANGNMLPFQEVLGQISKAADASGGNMDKVAFIAELVGLRGQKAASNLADLFDAGKTGALTEELNAAANSAQKMADIRMNTLEGDWTLLGSAVDAVKTKLFNVQSGPLRGLVQGVTKWVESLGNLDGASRIITNIGELLGSVWMIAKELASGVNAVFRAFLGAEDGVSTLEKINSLLFWLTAYLEAYRDEIKQIAKVAGVFVGLWIALSGIAKIWPALVLGAKILVGSFKGLWMIGGLLVKAMMTLVAAVGLVPILIGAAIVAAGVLLWYFWDDIVEIAKGIGRWFSDTWDGVANSAAETWTSIVNGVSGFIDQVKSAMQPLVDFLVGIWDTVAEGFKSSFGWILDSISTFIARFGGGDSAGAENGGQRSGRAQSRGTMVPPSTRNAVANSQHTERSTSELFVKAEPGTSVRRGRSRGPAQPTFIPSGAPAG